MITADNSALPMGRLLETLVADPRKLSLEFSELPSRINWEAAADINDIGRLTGKDASHRNAVRAILAWLGARAGEQWCFEILRPAAGERIETPRPVDDPNFDPEPIRQIVFDVFALGFEDPFKIEVRAGPGSNEWTLLVRPSSRRDLEAMMEARLVDSRREPMNVVEAFGTLVRAHGRRCGARLNFNLAEK